MPAAISPRARGPNDSAAYHALPPAKKKRLSQPSDAPRPNGLKALLHGAPAKLQAATPGKNGLKQARRDRVDEATAVVARGSAGHGDVDMADAGDDIVEISSGVESSEDDSSDDAAGDDGKAAAQEKGHVEGTAEPEELSFGERLQAQEPEPEPGTLPQVVDVEAALGDPTDARELAAASNNRALSAPSASSLGTVLTQALRTNDQELLDSCLRVIDVDTIYATVERLPSPLVGSLLEKLAGRLHKKPGRAGMLMVWVQWSLAAHGGYLASQPQLVKQLATLNKVLKERASGLQPLLALKGRLDMLHAQLELRRRNQRRAAFDEEDEAVIYVEGEDDVSSAEEDEGSVGDEDHAPASPRKRRRQDMEEEGESSVDEMPTTMEVDEDESDEGSEDSEDLLDDEAEETEDDSGDDMSEPMSDDLEDAEVGSESEGEEAKPARRSTAGRAGLSRRF